MVDDQFQADIFSSNCIERVEHWSSPIHEQEEAITFAQAIHFGKDLEGYYDDLIQRFLPEFSTGKNIATPVTIVVSFVSRPVAMCLSHHAIANRCGGSIIMPLPESGDSIPWNFDGCDDVQLIVAERDVTDARQLLCSFDLDICQNYFDGATLFVANLDALLTKRATIFPVSGTSFPSFQ